MPPKIRKEIWILKTKARIEWQSHYDSKLLWDNLQWLLDLGHTRDMKKQFLSSITQHWQMKNLLGLILKDKQVEKYNVFSSLEDIKGMLINHRFCLDMIDSRLAHVEGHIACESKSGDLLDPLGLSA